MARLALKRSEAVVERLRLDRDRADAFMRRSESMTGEAEGRLMMARGKLNEAQKKMSDVRRKNLPRHRWQADVRRWQAVADDSEAEVRRWGDEGNRADKDMNQFTMDLKDRQAAGIKAERELVALERRSIELARLGRGLRLDANARASDSQPLKITDRAMAALGEVLGTTPHDAQQAWRLALDEDGSVSLHLDEANQVDEVVAYGSSPLLIVSPESADQLSGKTLDVSESPEGTRIVIHD